MNVVKEHTLLFFRSDGCGKTHLVLNLLESEYRGHFDYIVSYLPNVKVEHHLPDSIVDQE